MENRTPAELQSDYSIRILRGFRNTLWLQFSQMSRAWRRHDPNDGDADTQTLAKLGTIVESTRVAVSHVLRISNDVLSKQSSRRPDASSDPNPYTSLSQFHRAVVPSTLPDPPLAQRLPYPGLTAGPTSRILSSNCSGQSDDATSEMSSRKRKTTTRLTSAARTRPKSPSRERKTTSHFEIYTHQRSNSLLKKPTERNLPEATPPLYRLHSPPIGGDGSMPRVRHRATGHLQEEVMVRGTRHTPASPRGARHANLVKGQSISIEGQHAGNYPQSMHFARPEWPLSTRTTPNDQYTTSTGLDAAPPITSAGLDAAPPFTTAGLDAAPPITYTSLDTAPPITSASSNRSQKEMKALCRPPASRPLQPKAGNGRGRYAKKQAKPPTGHNLAMKLDQPNTYWRCPFCPVEYNTFLALKAHNGEHHGGQLFRLQCGQCGFQTDSPKLLRGHQARMHAVKETSTTNESIAAVPADADTSAILINKDDASTPAGAAGTQTEGEPGELLCRETQKNDPATPEIGTPTREAMALVAGITNLDNVFLGPSLAPWTEDELQNIDEIEVMPIGLEDDSSHVICPTCYDYLPKDHYQLHKRSQNCYSPSRPPEIARARGLDPHHQDALRGGRPIRSELTGEQKSGWPPANHPPVIRRAKQHEIQRWSAIRGKITAVYKKALKKPNIDGSYNVNGQITSLQEIKRQIWNLQSCF